MTVSLFNFPAAAERTLVVALVLLFIGGCDLVDLGNINGEAGPPPEEAIAEIKVHGITFSSFTSPYPLVAGPEFDAVNARYLVDEEPYIGFSLLEFYFSPHPDHLIVDDLSPAHNPRGNFPYEYSYSIQAGSEFVEILKTEGDFNLEQSPNNYNGSVDLGQGPNEFIVVGNHVYDAVLVSIPARATHIEFWYREQPEAERQLVRRVALENFKAWRMYIKPLIDENLTKQ